MRARRQRWPHRHALAAGLSDHHETGLSDPDLTDALFASSMAVEFKLGSAGAEFPPVLREAGPDCRRRDVRAVRNAELSLSASPADLSRACYAGPRFRWLSERRVKLHALGVTP